MTVLQLVLCIGITLTDTHKAQQCNQRQRHADHVTGGIGAGEIPNGVYHHQCGTELFGDHKALFSADHRMENPGKVQSYITPQPPAYNSSD